MLLSDARAPRCGGQILSLVVPITHALSGAQGCRSLVGAQGCFPCPLLSSLPRALPHFHHLHWKVSILPLFAKSARVSRGPEWLPRLPPLARGLCQHLFRQSELSCCYSHSQTQLGAGALTSQFSLLFHLTTGYQDNWKVSAQQASRVIARVRPGMLQLS